MTASLARTRYLHQDVDIRQSLWRYGDYGLGRNWAEFHRFQKQSILKVPQSRPKPPLLTNECSQAFPQTQLRFDRGQLRGMPIIGFKFMNGIGKRAIWGDGDDLFPCSHGQHKIILNCFHISELNAESGLLREKGTSAPLATAPLSTQIRGLGFALI